VLFGGDPYTKEFKYCMKDIEGKDMCSDVRCFFFFGTIQYQYCMQGGEVKRTCILREENYEFYILNFFVSFLYQGIELLWEG